MSPLPVQTLFEPTLHEKEEMLLQELRSLDLNPLINSEIPIALDVIYDQLQDLSSIEYIDKNKQLMGFMIDGRGLLIPRCIFKNSKSENVAQKVYMGLVSGIKTYLDEVGLLGSQGIKVLGSVADGTCTFPCETDILPQNLPWKTQPLLFIYDIDLEPDWYKGNLLRRDAASRYLGFMDKLDILHDLLPEQIRPKDFHFTFGPSDF